MASLLQKLNQQGKTVLVVTHDIEFVSDYIPRVVVMSHGRVIADGPSGDVLVRRDVLERASLVPPQLAEISWELGLDPPSIRLDDVVARLAKTSGGRSDVKVFKGFEYRRGTTPIHTLDPRAKLVYLILFTATRRPLL